ncbi:MAG: hypothetical protein ACAI35_15395 [Candidatus Methylacidiphilales bacterium]|nr:hypothetical protein [Candidatus Methylacidiphilales bacterium]
MKAHFANFQMSRIAACLAVIATTTLYPAPAHAQTDLRKLADQQTNTGDSANDTSKLCELFAEEMQKPVPIRDLKDLMNRARPDVPAAGTETNSSSAEQLPEVKKEKLFELVASSSNKDGGREMEKALERAVGRNLSYDQFSFVQLAHVEKSDGERLITLYAMRLSPKSLADIRPVLSDPASRGRFQSKIVKNVLLIMVVSVGNPAAERSPTPAPATITNPSELTMPGQQSTTTTTTSTSTTSRRPRTSKSAGIAKSEADMDKRLTELDNGVSSPSTLSTPSESENTSTSGRNRSRQATPESEMTPQELAQRKESRLKLASGLDNAMRIFNKL